MYTVEALYKDRFISHTYMLSQHLVFGNRFICIEMRPSARNYVVLQDKWSFMVVIAEHRCHCIPQSVSMHGVG